MFGHRVVSQKFELRRRGQGTDIYANCYRQELGQECGEAQARLEIWGPWKATFGPAVTVLGPAKV